MTKILIPKAKYAIGSKVWRLIYDKAQEYIITGVAVCFRDGSEFERWEYSCSVGTNPRQFDWIHEKNLFESKEALLNSL